MKVFSALLTVAAGIGAALALYWLLNKLSELLPGRWEHRIKPYFFIAPAFLAVALYLIYPAIVTVLNSFQDRASEEWVGFENYSELLSSTPFQKTLFNTLLWILIVPATTVVIGLAVAVLADRLKPGCGEAQQDRHLPADGDRPGRGLHDLGLHLRRRGRRGSHRSA